MGMGLKLTLAAAAVAAAGGAYYVNQSGGLSNLNVPGLVAAGPVAADFVPADSLFFAGSLKPMNINDSLKLYKEQLGGVPFSDIQKTLDSLLSDTNPDVPTEKKLSEPGQRFAVAFVAEYLKELATPDTFASRLGLDIAADSAVYTVGPLPVIRLKLASEPAFREFLTRVEQRAGVSATQAKYNEAAYQTYALNKAGEPHPLLLAVGIRDGFAVLTLDAGDLLPKDQALAVALGVTKPAASLSASGRLQKLVKDYGLDARSLGYLNHQAIAASLTDPKSLLGGLIDKLSTTPSESLAQWRSDACQKDVAALTAAWPQTVIGYTKLDVQSEPKKADLLVQLESTDQVSLQELQKLRGFIPSLVSADTSWLSFGLGLNVDNLAPVLGSLWTRATQAPLACQPLKELQQGLTEANPMMLGMMTGMVQGVEGLSFALTNLQLTPGATPDDEPKLQALSALLVLSAKDPKRLWDTAAGMQPMLASVTFPEQGKAVDLALPLPPEVPVKLKLGLYGTNLVLFTNDAATQQQAEALAKEPLAANGLYRAALQYKPLMAVAKPFLDQAEAKADSPEEKKVFSDLRVIYDRDIKASGELDIDAKGIKVTSKAEIRSAVTK